MEEIEEIMDDECPIIDAETFISQSAYQIRHEFNCYGYEDLARVLKDRPRNFLAYIDMGTSLGNRLPKNHDYIALIECGGGNLCSNDKDKADILYAQEILNFKENPLWEDHKARIWHTVLRHITRGLHLDGIIALPYMSEEDASLRVPHTGVTITKL